MDQQIQLSTGDKPVHKRSVYGGLIKDVHPTPFDILEQGQDLLFIKFYGVDKNGRSAPKHREIAKRILFRANRADEGDGVIFIHQGLHHNDWVLEEYVFGVKEPNRVVGSLQDMQAWIRRWFERREKPRR